MRLAGSIVVIALSLAVTPVKAQEFDASGPEVPRTTQDDAEQEINRLRAIIRELEGEISKLKQEGVQEDAADRKENLKGAWLGTVSCGRRQFSITFTVSEQFGRVGRGKWEFAGSATGVDEAQISPMPTQEMPGSFTIVTAKANIYDYVVQLDRDTLSGKATQQNCQIYLERG